MPERLGKKNTYKKISKREKIIAFVSLDPRVTKLLYQAAS